MYAIYIYCIYKYILCIYIYTVCIYIYIKCMYIYIHMSCIYLAWVCLHNCMHIYIYVCVYECACVAMDQFQIQFTFQVKNTKKIAMVILGTSMWHYKCKKIGEYVDWFANTRTTKEGKEPILLPAMEECTKVGSVRHSGMKNLHLQQNHLPVLPWQSNMASCHIPYYKWRLELENPL